MSDIFKGVDLDNIDTGYILREGQKKLMKGLQMSSEPNPLGTSVFDSGFGEHVVGEVNMSFVSNFAYQSDTRKLQSISTNGGTITNENSMLVLSSGTNANGSAIGRSKRSLPYKAGQESFVLFTAEWDAPVINNKRFAGLFDNLNGYAIGYDGLDFGILRRKDSVDVEFVKQADFNIDKLDGTGVSKFNIDKTKINVFRISFIYLGAGPIKYWVLGDNGWINFHTIKYQNRNNTTHVGLPYLKIGIENVNNGNTTNVKVQSGSVACGSVGGANRIVSSRNFTKDINASILGGLVANTIAVFHLKSTYGVVPVENRIENLLKYLTIATDGTKNVIFRRYKLAVAPIGGAWSDVSPNSMMEINTTPTTVDLTDAELTFAVTLSKVDSKAFDLINQELRGLPNDYIAYVLLSDNASLVSLTTTWDELF